jgi:8-oxo-dGTP diphosphatase
MQHVVIAILYYVQPDGSRRYLLQLRDDIPTIAFPGKWGFFGGAVEEGESPDDAVTRELEEEISASAEMTLVRRLDRNGYAYHIFAGTPRVELSRLVLREGWDLGLFTPEEILRGTLRAPNAGVEREIIAIGMEILRDYFDSLSEPRV